ncbi:MAG: ChaN family lipoprotein [Phycisphaerae bacterium]
MVTHMGSVATFARLTSIALVALGLIGCTARDREPTRPPALVGDPRAVAVFDGATGRTVAWHELVAAAAAAEVVIVGENHGHALGLASAAALWEDVVPLAPQAALSLEFFERDEQSRIDDYLAGLADEARFRARTLRTESNYPLGHRAMVESAKRHGCRVYAANAPRALVSLARREGYERFAALTAEQQRLVRIPGDLPTGRYREDFDRFMRESGGVTHGSGDPPSEEEIRTRLDAIFRSQSMWDWTMAETIVRALAEGARPVVHVVGRFHSDFRGGLVHAIERQRAATELVTVSYVNESAPRLRDDDRERATFVIYVGPAERAAKP